MISVKEILTSENSFFEAFERVNPTLYTFLFESDEPPIIDYSTTTLDMALLVACGDRYAAPLLTHYTLDEVVSFIIAKYGNSWQRIQKAIAADYDVIKPYNVTQVTTGEKTGGNETSSENIQKMGEYGFDSEETAADKSIDTNTNSVTIAQNETNNTTVETSGNNGNVKFSDLIANEIEVRKNSFVSLVIKDIQTQITLDIY